MNNLVQCFGMANTDNTTTYQKHIMTHHVVRVAHVRVIAVPVPQPSKVAVEALAAPGTDLRQ